LQIELDQLFVANEEYRIRILKTLKGQKLPFTFIMDDPCGKSYLEVNINLLKYAS